MSMKYIEKKCEICGELFLSKMGLEKYCKNQHTKSCIICGESITFYGNTKTKTCSKKCTNILRNITVQERYGVSNAFNTKYFNHQLYVPKKISLDCKLCGKKFIPNGTQKYCNNQHYKKCKICRKEFKIDVTKINTKCCSRKCASEYSRITLSKQSKTCLYCGNVFYSASSRKKYCREQHIRFCQICGKSFSFDPQNSNKITCSVECKNILRKQTNIKKYGVDVVSKSVDIKQILSEKSIENSDKRKQTCINRYGVDNPVKSEKIKQKISTTMSSDASQNKFTATMLQRYGVRYAAQNKDIRHKQQNHYKITASDGIMFDSSWELNIYEMLLQNNVQPDLQIPFEFYYENKKHVTFIDFKVDDKLVEVKGSHLINGLYKDKTNVPIDVKLHLYEDNNVILITDKAAFSILEQYNITFIDYNRCTANTIMSLLNGIK